jgi:hypothetical protein
LTIFITARAAVHTCWVGPLHVAFRLDGTKLKVLPVWVMSDVGSAVALSEPRDATPTTAVCALPDAVAEATPAPTVTLMIPAATSAAAYVLVFIGISLARLRWSVV